MKLISLEIHNYGYWNDQKVDFTDQKPKPEACSKIMICGEQESGKSTIGGALRWLLYGDLQRKAEKSYPSAWKGQQKDEQFVRAIFHHQKEGQLILTRTRKPPSNETIRTLKVKTEEIPQKAVSARWQRLFGKSPTREEEVEYILRVQQMVDTAKKISDPEQYQARLLSFVNMDDIIGRMDSVISDLTTETRNAEGASNSPKAVAELARLEIEVGLRDDKIGTNQKEIDEIGTFLEKYESEETEIEALIKKSDKHKQVSADFVEAIGGVATARAEYQAGLENIVSANLYGLLVNAGCTDALPSKDSTAAEDFKLRAVIDEFSSHLSTNSKKKLEGLIDPNSTLNCVKLLEAPDISSEVVIVCTNLEEALNTVEEASVAQIAVNAEIQISPEKAMAAKLDVQEAIDSAARREVLKARNTRHKEQIELYKDDITKQTDIIANAGKEGDAAVLLAKQAKIARSILTATRKARDAYVESMFTNLISVIQDFWIEIDAGHSKATIEWDSDERTIKLKDTASGEWIDLQYADGVGDASSGQFEKSLLCMAMARIKITGRDMPVFMDDAMGDIDPKHKKRAIDSAAKHFGQVIYVTNSPQIVEDLTSLDLKIKTINPKQTNKGIEYKVKP